MMSNTSIDKIIVTNLFGQFTHELTFNNDSNVSIFIAPNGCGKTTIFNFINFLLNPGVNTMLPIIHVPFLKFQCFLSNGIIIELEKENPEEGVLVCVRSIVQGNDYGPTDNIEGYEWTFRITIRDKKTSGVSFSFQEKYKELMDKPGYLQEQIENIKISLDPQMFYGKGLNMKEGAQCIPRLYAKMSLLCCDYKKFLHENNCDFSVSFISANRLDSPKTTAKLSAGDISRGFSVMDFTPEDGGNDILQQECNEAKTMIAEVTGKYNDLLVHAKNELPKKYLLEEESPQQAYDIFKKRWDEYRERLKKYHDVGLLANAEEILSEDKLLEVYNKKASFLNIYLDTFEKTLAPFENEGIYEKIKLFIDIYQSRNEITQKSVRFSLQKGIEILVNGEQVDIHYLSSGEKHDYVMFFQLIFRSTKGGIVLIDEPEISWHINWQLEYLDWLIRICKMNGLRAIVATHSPCIINGHMDMYVKRETY